MQVGRQRGTERLQVTLGPVAETLLVPLYGRAVLTRQGSPLIDDPRAVEMVDAIDWDFARFEGAPSLVGSVLRTRLLDVWLERWLQDNPDGTVVEIGAGLNTRFERVDNGRAPWVDVDLPDAMALRRRFVDPSPRRQLVPLSITDDAWIETVPPGGPWFVIAEAVLAFLSDGEVRQALATISGRLPGAVVAFDTWGSWLRDNQDQHDVLKVLDAEVTWFCDDPHSIQSWVSGLHLVESRTLAELPEPLASLVPDEVRASMTTAEAKPQVDSYRVNLFRNAMSRELPDP